MGQAATDSMAATLDRTGVIASVGCAIHCMVAPLLVVFAPTLGGWWVHPATHLLIAALVLPVAASALKRGYRTHRKRWIMWAGMGGMALVGIGVVLPYIFPATCAEGICRACCPTMEKDAVTGAMHLHIPPASVLTLMGGIALVTAHIGNLRCGGCRRCDH